MSEREQQALKAWADVSSEAGYLPFRAIARLSGLPLKHVRRTVRSMARRGLTVYERGLWNEDGEPCGSGYGLTDAGRAALSTYLESKKSKKEKAWEKGLAERLAAATLADQAASEAPPHSRRSEGDA